MVRVSESERTTMSGVLRKLFWLSALPAICHGMENASNSSNIIAPIKMVSKMRSDREGAQLQCTLLNWALANHFGLEWLAAYPQPRKLGQLTRHLGLPAIRNLDEFHRMKQVTINRVNDGTEATIRAVEPNSLIVQNDHNLHGWMSGPG